MKIIGVLNITPDSFFDGGKFLEKDAAIAHTLSMIQDGADVIDIGAESTKPDGVSISQREEIKRLDGVLQEVIALCRKHNVLTSIDSYNPETVRFALDSGINLINPQKNVEKMAEILMEKGRNDIPIVLMHSVTIPVEIDADLPDDIDVVETLKAWFTEKLTILESIGISREKIIIDPGLGFGKTTDQCNTIIKSIDSFKSFSLPIMLGHSNKRFVRRIESQCENVRFTLPISAILFAKKIDYIRVHEVRGHRLLLSHFFEQ
ncbi:dihydropteroate synthase [Neorickettsia helminthoeca]|nr:dihydropteroate synthase [Neorickettsia helminthoeca]